MGDGQPFRVVLLTGNGLRHRYVAARLAQSLRLVGTVLEGKAQLVAEPERLPPEDQRVIAEHLGERDAVERRLLGACGELSGPVLEVPHGQSNTVEVYDWVVRQAPDFIVVYGSSIIKPPLLERYDGRMVNIHLGLSPYYRGSGTNFWPLVHRLPECVGATLHLIVAKVDAGPILAQVRPMAEATDRAHELGTKTIIEAVAHLPGVLRAFAQGILHPKLQDLSLGRLCRRRDFSADAVRTMWKQFDSGMMDDYLADRVGRCANYPLVESPSAAASRSA
jgi:hypothetical protein